MYFLLFFFFQAEDGIRDRSPSRGLGDVYKRQDYRVIKGQKVETNRDSWEMSAQKVQRASASSRLESQMEDLD